MPRILTLACVCLVALILPAVSRAADAPAPVQESASGITHGLLVTGGETYILAGDGKVAWTYPQSTRDGWVLPDGNVLLALSRRDDLPGGGAVEVTREGKVVFEFKGTQAEVNTVQPLPGGRVLLTEAGPKPRIIEVDRAGRVRVDVPIQAQTHDHHLQTRMARKLPNGNYLVPQLVDKVVREYTPEGKVVWEAPTPNWPFTAIRLDNGNTLINCTVGNVVIEVDPAGKTVWELANADLGAELIKDACGGQRLPNGNTVITSYRAAAGEVSVFEVTPEKKVVWTLKTNRPSGVHHFQVLDTNGEPLDGPAMR